MAIYLKVVKTFNSKLQKSTSWWRCRKRISRIHPVGTMTVCTKVYVNHSECRAFFSPTRLNQQFADLSKMTKHLYVCCMYIKLRALINPCAQIKSTSYFFLSVTSPRLRIFEILSLSCNQDAKFQFRTSREFCEAPLRSDYYNILHPDLHLCFEQMDHSCVGTGADQTSVLQSRRITVQLSQRGGTHRIQSDETNSEVLKRIISFSNCARTSRSSHFIRERDSSSETRIVYRRRSQQV